MKLQTQTCPAACVASVSRNGFFSRAVRRPACLVLILVCASLSAIAATNTVDCDFGVKLKVGPMNGILEGWDGTNPSDEMIHRILNTGDYARIFIYHEEAVKRAIQMGCRVVARLDRYERMTGKEPFEDWAAWKKWCADLAAKWGTKVIYEVWNETRACRG